jgi:hypothetical protein
MQVFNDTINVIIFAPVTLQPILGPFLFYIDVSESHTIRHTVGLLWTSDQPVAEASTYTGQHNI